MSSQRFSIGPSELYLACLNNVADRREAIEWLRARVNDYVNVFRPWIQDIVEELS